MYCPCSPEERTKNCDPPSFTPTMAGPPLSCKVLAKATTPAIIPKPRPLTEGEKRGVGVREREREEKREREREGERERGREREHMNKSITRTYHSHILTIGKFVPSSWTLVIAHDLQHLVCSPQEPVEKPAKHFL